MAGKQLHDFNKLRFTDPKPNARGFAVIGDVGMARASSVDAILRRFRQSQVPVYHTSAETSLELFRDLSQRNYMASDFTVVAENAAEYLKESDVPKLHRLLTKTEGQPHLIVTGTKFSNTEVEQQFKRTMCAIFNINFASSESGQQHFNTLIEKEFDLTTRHAVSLASKLQYNVDSALQLAEKAKAFDYLSFVELDRLAESSTHIAFSEALIRLKLADAMVLTENMTRNQSEMILATVLRHFRHITTIYPLTRQVKVPGVQQSKQSRLPLKTIQRWWSVAGRYPPREQIRRHLLLVETSDRIYREPSRDKNTFGAWEHLVLGW